VLSNPDICSFDPTIYQTKVMLGVQDLSHLSKNAFSDEVSWKDLEIAL